MPDRKGFPHPCGSAAPSRARTLCSSGMSSFPAGLMHRFKKQEADSFYWGWHKTVAVGGGCRVRKGMPDRKGFPHPCGSAAPSRARTLCSSGMSSFPAGLMHRFKKQEADSFYWGWHKTVAVGGGCRVRKGMPDRKGFPHPCGSAAPSRARTLCSSGMSSFPAGLMHRFKKQEADSFYWGWHKTVAVGGGCRVRKGMPDRKGFPHPCGSAAPSRARTLCSSGMPFLPGWADASL